MPRRTERVADLLLETLSELVLREVKDPRVGLVTFTRVDLSPDLRNATVYFSTFGDAEAGKQALGGLASAAGFLQGKAARLLRMRYAPELRFVYDLGFEHAARIDRLLRREDEPPDDSGESSR